MVKLFQTAQPVDPAIAHVIRLTKASGSSFYWGMRVLPRAKREAMFAVYAFCREVDDIADEPGELSAKRQALDDWRRQVDELFEGRATSLTGQALLGPIQNFKMDKEPFLAMIDGMQMDAEGPIQAPDFQTFLLYCDRVAGAVGLMSQSIFGDPSPKAKDLARDLGQALQITNILRDVAEDAEIGRLYLPREYLTRYGITSTDPSEVLAHPRISAVLAELAELAEMKFADARADLDQCQRPLQKPAIIMMSVYYRLLQALKQRGWQDFRTTVGPSKLTKLWLAIFHGTRSK